MLTIILQLTIQNRALKRNIKLVKLCDEQILMGYANKCIFVNPSVFEAGQRVCCSTITGYCKADDVDNHCTAPTFQYYGRNTKHSAFTARQLALQQNFNSRKHVRAIKI